MGDFKSHDGTVIHYEDEGEGPPVMMMHGFAADSHITWGRPGVVEAVVQAGMRAVTLDNRGHGKSGRSHDSASYTLQAVIGDVMSLMEHLEIPHAAMAGYSVGSRMAIEIATTHPEKVTSVALCGVGAISTAPTRIWGSEEIAQGLEAPRASEVQHARARAFRSFAEATGGDLRSLAAFQRAMINWSAPVPQDIDFPCIVIVGEKDDIAGAAEPLAERIEGATSVYVPGNHMNAIVRKEFREALLGFLVANAIQ